MDLDNIPQTKTKGFPAGVSEVKYATQAEMTAFLDGLNFASDIDVENGMIFQRDGQYVVRVKVGDFGDDDEFEDDDLEDEDLE